MKYRLRKCSAPCLSKCPKSPVCHTTLCHQETLMPRTPHSSRQKTGLFLAYLAIAPCWKSIGVKMNAIGRPTCAGCISFQNSIAAARLSGQPYRKHFISLSESSPSMAFLVAPQGHPRTAMEPASLVQSEHLKTPPMMLGRAFHAHQDRTSPILVHRSALNPSARPAFQWRQLYPRLFELESFRQTTSF